MALSNSATKLVEVFLKFLSDEITPVNAEDTLQIMLRTEGKVYFSPEQIAKICFHWASQRKTLVDNYTDSICTSLLRIYQANEFCSLKNFKLDQFVKPFIKELFSLCPVDERELLMKELPLVKEKFKQSLQDKSKKTMQEYEVQLSVDGDTTVTEGEWIQITGEKFNSIHHDLETIVENNKLNVHERFSQIQKLIPELDASFKNVINDKVLKDRLAHLVPIAKDFFNAGEVESANLLFGFISQIVDNRRNQFLEKELSSLTNLDEINDKIIEDYLSNKEKKKLLKPLFSNIFPLRPQNLLSSLIQEGDANKRKQLLKFITVYEPEIFHNIMEELSGSDISKWYFKRNLLFLLTHIERPSDTSVSTVIDVVKKYIHPDMHPALIKEAVKTYLYFNPKEGVDFVLNLLNAQHPSDVIHMDRFYEPKKLEQFLQDVISGVSSFDFAHHPEAIKVIFNLIKDELSQSSGMLGRFKTGIRIERVSSYLTMLSSTVSPTLWEALSKLASESKNKTIKEKIHQVIINAKKGSNNFF